MRKLAAYSLIVALAVDGTASHYRYTQAVFQSLQDGGRHISVGLDYFMSKLLGNNR
jgi:hypothetical protein